MDVLNLGLVEYSQALKTQEDRIAAVRESNQEVLLVCEHPFVVTVGRGLGATDDILDKSVPTFEVARGGRSTLHAPGQVVIYPILNLQKRGISVHQMLRLLEQAIINTLDEFGIKACRIEGKTGVWVKESRLGVEKKIASLGIAVRQGVSYHGLALNVCNDLKLFQKINPCGFSSDVMTSVEKETDEKDEELKKQVEESLLSNLKDLLGE